MKTKTILGSLLLSLLVLVGTTSWAQQRDGSRNKGDRDQRGSKERMAYLDLTEDQQAQAKVFYTDMQEEMTPLKLDLKEKKLHLDKLMIAEPVNEKEIYAKVDEMSDLRAQMQKVKIAQKLKFRSILDADQKVLFDAQQTGKRKSKGNKGRNGKNQAECRR